MYQRIATLITVLALSCTALAQPLSTAFTYQARLDNGASTAAGLYDFRFSLFDAPSGGTQLGPTLCLDNVPVAAGLFSVQLDFGAQFSGSQRFLQIQTRPDTGLDCSNTSGFTTLSPRQPLTAAPNATYSLNTTQLNSQPASFYTNAANLTGLLPDACLSPSVALLSLPQTFVSPKTFLSGSLLLRNSANSLSTTLDAPSATAARSILFPDASGTVITTGNLSAITSLGAIPGTITAGAFAYTAPVTSHYMVSETSFRSRDGIPVGCGTAEGGAYPIGSTMFGLVAPVNLPDGCTITAVYYYFIDNSTTANLEFVTLALSPSQGGYDAVHIDRRSTGSSAAVQTLSSTGLSVLVDNSVSSYEVQVYPVSAAWTGTTSAGSTMMVMGARIDYTLPRPAR